MLKTMRNTFAGAGMVAMATVGPLTGNAIAEDAEVRTSYSQSQRIQASDFGHADENNVGIIMYYGLGNRTPPEKVEDMLLNAVDSAAERAGFPVDARVFTRFVDNFEGVAVTYSMGGVSIDGVDVRAAIKEPTTKTPYVITDQVIQKRIDVNDTLELAGLNF